MRYLQIDIFSVSLFTLTPLVSIHDIVKSLISNICNNDLYNTSTSELVLYNTSQGFVC